MRERHAGQSCRKKYRRVPEIVFSIRHLMDGTKSKREEGSEWNDMRGRRNAQGPAGHVQLGIPILLLHERR